MGGGEAKTWFDDVCKVKYGVRHLKVQIQYIVVQALWPKAGYAAIFFSLEHSQEKVQIWFVSFNPNSAGAKKPG